MEIYISLLTFSIHMIDEWYQTILLQQKLWHHQFEQELPVRKQHTPEA